MSMPDHTIFFRLLDHADKAKALAAAVAALPTAPTTDTFSVTPASLRQIPGTPFAYWANTRLRNLFKEFQSINDLGIEALVGLATGNDFRFLRLNWEVLPRKLIGNNNKSHWRNFSKGGAFSPYYFDSHLIIDWHDDGKAIEEFFVGARIKKPFFRPGLTWPLRSQVGFGLRVLPKGCIFAGKGPSIFVQNDQADDLMCLLAIANSTPFTALISLQMAFGSYEVGVIQRTVIPPISAEDGSKIAELARQAHDVKRGADCDDEVTHPFGAPTLVRMRGMASIAAMAREFASITVGRERRLWSLQREIDEIAFRLYGISDADRQAIEASLHGTTATPPIVDEEEDADATAANIDDEGEEEAAAAPTSDPAHLAADLVSYALGCAFGRWDVRIGRDPSLAPLLAEPFSPLPVCAPGALVGTDGLPARAGGIVSEAWLRARPDAITLPPAGAVDQPTIPDTDYPLTIAWDGILVEDATHPRDVLHAVRRVLACLWGNRAVALEDELCAVLGVPDLRTYLRNPGGFFDYHIKRYSKSRRKAPIYWLLQSPKKHYGVWLAYHRLDRDLLSKVLALYVRPRIAQEQQTLATLASALGEATAADERRRHKTAFEKQQALLADLTLFEERLVRTVQLDHTPDLNDGVLLNAAPLWELIAWREAKTAWAQLVADKYPWSTIGRHLRAIGRIK